MPNLRPLAVIGLASAVAAIAPAAFKFEGIPRLARPAVYSILIRPETVWFCAVVPVDSQRVAYGFARRTREWKTVSDHRRCPEVPKQRITFDSLPPIAIAAGLRSEVVYAPRDSAGIPRGRSWLRLVDSSHSLQLDLKPVVASERIPALLAQPGGSVDDDTTAVLVGGTAANDTLAWIGLRGGFPEGTGALGGIFRIDRRAGTWTYLVDSTLSWHAVTGLAQTRDWLWVGTEQPAEYGPMGRAGLLRMDLRSGQWRAFTAENSPLPDALIVKMAGSEDLIAVATERGLAVAELRQSSSPREIERWSVQHLVPAFAGDSLVYRLAPVQDSVSEDAEAPFIFVQTYAARGHERPVFEQLKSVPLAAIKDANDGFVDGAPELADPKFAPIIEAMLTSHADAQRLAADAVRQLGRRAPTDVRVAVRSTFLAYDTLAATRENGETRRRLAAALRSFGDSTAIRWARRTLDRSQATIGPQLESSRTRTRQETAISVLAEARDPRGLPLLIAMAGGDRQMDMQLTIAFATYDTPRSWRALHDLIVHRSRLSTSETAAYDARDLARRATPTAMTDPGIRRIVVATIRDELRQTRGDIRGEAVLNIQRLRLAEFARELVDQLSDSSSVRFAAYSTLVDLFGRADAPVFRDNPPADAVAWWKAVVRSRPSAVSRAQGERALRSWSRRRLQLIKPPAV